MRFLNVLFGFVLLLKSSSSDFYSAVSDMSPLLKTEEIIIEVLEKYVTDLEKKLEKLKRHMNYFKIEHEKVGQDLEEYFFNPINGFLLIKRLTVGWQDIKALMSENQGVALLDQTSTLQFPDLEDLSGATDAIVRLQETYNLNVSDIARGKLKNIQFNSTMTANDCFEIGEQSYEIEDHVQTVLWMEEANRIYDTEVYKTVSKARILEYLAPSKYEEGDLTTALRLTNELLDINATNEIARTNKVLFEASITAKKIKSKMKLGPYEREISDELCSREVTVDEKIKSKLKCRYVDYGRNYLKLAKLKEEELYLNPKMLLYHDVIYDKEIDKIKELVKSNLTRAEVFGNAGKSVFRISKVGWLQDEDHPYIARISQRIEDMTGLNINNGEAYQIINYGIGGYYASHFDWVARDEGKLDSEDYQNYGDRIATVLFYMSDVKQGGGTAFPNLKVAGQPRKGTALVWYNLFLNGTESELVLHAACPVLTGSKWVLTRWMAEKGQEFRRPCSLSRYEI